MALPRDLKELNKRHIKSILRQRGAMTKAEIAEITDLSVVTVNKLIRALEEDDEIIEQDSSVVTGGRRAISYKINPNFQQILVVSLQEKWKKITYSFSVYNLLGEVEFVEDMSGEDLDIHALKRNIKDHVCAFPKISCIVICVPGIEIGGRLRAMDFPLLLNVHLRETLESEVNLPVLVETDTNAAILGYKNRPVTENNIVGLYYPERFPPGAGLLMNGEILKGKNGLAGEIKYIPLQIDWDNFDFSVDKIKEHIRKMVLLTMSFYDPETIVIYTNFYFGQKDFMEELTLSLAEIYPYARLPKILLSRKFTTDYRIGLFAFGIDYLENNLTDWRI
ncbi:ROK family transcriptional regulator [Listeria ivanovii subsp. londoniensis]|uniref:ROK family transcriptional regulator n=1 Tax=Listeria ivanovii TaxID=1638 RepID=UPI00051285EA|nr:ROK family transcriptional regulator [Listeria ivanovii]AIS58917.1 ROK family transcriptional regulator [Listeria ivanovii subsp. londoniensis]